MNFRAEVYAKARNTRKGTKLRRRAEDWSVFSERQVDFVQMKTIAIFCTRMPRDAVRLCGKKWKTQENLTQNKYPLQDRKWRNGLTWKTQTVWRPVLRLELKKIPCLWLTRWKRSSCNYRHHPVCRGYKSGKHVHLWHSLPFFDMLDEK